MEVMVYLFLGALLLAFLAGIFLIIEINNKTSEIMNKEEIIDGLKKELEEEKKKRKDMEEISETDLLTKLPNRRGLENFIQRHWKRHAWEDGAMAIVLADINNFKNINDTQGHQAGDLCLIDVAIVLKKVLRSTDFLARWGGDEFMLILPDISFREASEIAQRARAAVEKIGETISVGIAFGIPERDFATVDEMVKEADKQMYIEKNSLKK